MVSKLSQGRAPLFLMAISALLILSSTPGAAQNQLAYEGPGVDQSYPEQHMLFLKGVEDGQYLDRNWTTVTGLPSGSVSFSKSSSLTLPTIVDAFSAPTEEPFRFEGNITILLFASLESNSDICSISDLPVGG
ncbi:MAG: hypothetical protein VX461_01165, partial [Candidatus Thermoplasmatota archaeon]|nr:hypothetical protein [Candidatus Thermoplasmatota archaeon]